MSSFHSNYHIALHRYQQILLSLRATLINTAASLLGSKGKHKPSGLGDNYRVCFRGFINPNSVSRV